MNKKERIKFANLFKALSSEENIDLFTQICQSDKLTTELKTNLTRMPLNRRLNILMGVGLIERVRSSKGYQFINQARVDKSKIHKFIKLLNKKVSH